MDITCRKASLADVEEIKSLFADTIMNVNIADYSPEEAADWALCGERKVEWSELVSQLYFIVATDGDGRIVGFAAMTDDGYLDYMFVHKACQGCGVASSLLSVVETHARSRGITEVTSDVSVTALPFFRHRGYVVEKEQKARACKLYLTNYKMRKQLETSVCLSTARLVLRRWREDDAVALYKYASHPDVGPIAGWPPHTSVEHSREIIRTVFAAPETYAVVLKETGEPVGSVGIMFADGMHSAAMKAGEAEIGYWIGVPYWGQGLIPEAVDCLLHRCFADLNLSAVWCGYYDGNRQSRRVMEKCGFKFHHTEPEKMSPLGDMRTEHFMRMTRDEWKCRVAVNDK